MKKSVKSLVLITIAVFFVNNSKAQLKLPVLNGVASDVKKVIEDHPNHFTNIKGEMISQTAQTTDYACTFNANGAEETTITQYSSKKEMYSWQALMLTTESFDKAKQKFKSLFNQLNNLSFKIGDHIYKLKGDYEQPDENKKFASSILSAGDKMKVEITLQAYEPMEWKVKIIVYDREREDDEKGDTKE